MPTARAAPSPSPRRALGAMSVEWGMLLGLSSSGGSFFFNKTCSARWSRSVMFAAPASRRIALPSGGGLPRSPAMCAFLVMSVQQLIPVLILCQTPPASATPRLQRHRAALRRAARPLGRSACARRLLGVGRPGGVVVMVGPTPLRGFEARRWRYYGLAAVDTPSPFTAGATQLGLRRIAAAGSSVTTLSASAGESSTSPGTCRCPRRAHHHGRACSVSTAFGYISLSSLRRVP